MTSPAASAWPASERGRRLSGPCHRCLSPASAQRTRSSNRERLRFGLIAVRRAAVQRIWAGLAATWRLLPVAWVLAGPDGTTSTPGCGKRGVDACSWPGLMSSAMVPMAMRTPLVRVRVDHDATPFTTLPLHHEDSCVSMCCCPPEEVMPTRPEAGVQRVLQPKVSGRLRPSENEAGETVWQSPTLLGGWLPGRRARALVDGCRGFGPSGITGGDGCPTTWWPGWS